MKKINGWDVTPAVIGSGNVWVLPANNYICKIVDAQETVSKNGRPMLKLAFDIAEGEFTDFYKNRFVKDKETKKDKAKWNNDAIFYQLTDGEALGRFKGVIECLEESNNGWKWEWDETKLVGCRFCGQFRNEPSIYNGKTYNHTKLINIYPTDKIETLGLLPSKEIKNSANDFNGGFGGSQVSDDDIPF